MRVTPSARTDLLEAVARLNREDPERAARFVFELENRLADLGDDLEDVPELGSPRHSATASHGHRVYLRERTNGMWLIAVWPEPDLRDPI